MRILIVSENFTNGGLETQILTQYEQMCKHHKFFFAFARYQQNEILPRDLIFDNFNFSVESTIKEFCSDVENLIKIIKENKIDIVHVHPFYSLFPAVFAAKLSNVPVVYSYHGYASFNFPSRINDLILFQNMIESEIDKIFSVSIDGVLTLDNATLSKKTFLLPNSIDVKKYKINKIINNKRWALISRLDIGKIEEIKKVISIMDDIDIKEIDIYGDGPEASNLKLYINELEKSKRVKLLGQCSNLYQFLDGKYNGLIGIGRVVFESLTMGYPTLFIGYGKIAGIVDYDLYLKAKDYNFVNKRFPEISISDLKKQVQNVYKVNKLDEQIIVDIRKNYSSQKIYSIYEKELCNIKYDSFYDLKNLFCELKKIENCNVNMYTSKEVYDLLKKYIECVSLSTTLKNYFLNFDNRFILLDYTNTISENMKNIMENSNNIILQKQFLFEKDVKEKLDILDHTIQDNKIMIEDKINIKFMFYKTFQIIIKKIKSIFK